MGITILGLDEKVDETIIWPSKEIYENLGFKGGDKISCLRWILV